MKKDVNPVVCSALDVAEVYVRSHPLLASHPTIWSTLLDFRGGRISAGFAKLGELASEFGCDFEHNTAFRQFSALVRKVPYKVSDLDREALAIKAFHKTETKCRRTNMRLRFFRLAPDRRGPITRVVLSRAREYIRGVLGQLTEGTYGRILELSRPGGGLAVGSWNRFRTSPTYKYVGSTLAYSPDSLPVVKDFLSLHSNVLIKEHGVWCGRTVRYPLENWCTPGNRLAFVPKDGKILRSIAVEPNLNVMIQLGVHEWMRDRFVSKRVADLGDQSVNQRLSWLGSLSPGLGGLATIDLESASDSISIELVRELLPSSWFHFLDCLRCKVTSHNGRVIKSEKFSTMGNGFTFALETLIFKALAEAACSLVAGTSVTAVYGDDIILPSSCVPILLETFKHVGLTVNNSKSFVFGDFRESCGTDWYFGRYATPIYNREENLTVRDAYRIWNTFPRSDPASPKVRTFLFGKVKAKGGVRFGLENDDPSSCFFTTAEYLAGSGMTRYKARFQRHEYRVLVSSSERDRYAPQAWRYANALLDGKSTLSLRGMDTIVERWSAHGWRNRSWHESASSEIPFPSVPYDFHL